MVERILDKAWSKLPAEGWVGWPALFRKNLLEYLTRRSVLDKIARELEPLDRAAPVELDQEEEADQLRLPDRGPPLVRSVFQALARRLGPGVTDTWFGNCGWTVDGKTVSVRTPSPFHTEWIRKNYAIDLCLSALELGVKILPEELCKEIPASSVEIPSRPATEVDLESPAEPAATTNGAP